MKKSGKGWTPIKLAGFFLGSVLFCLLYFFNPLEINSAANNTAAVAAMMACWWMFESLPLGATALVPVILFPLLGVLDGKTVASSYFNTTIMLFLGGFMIAVAMEKWQLHKRISMKILRSIGGTPPKMILGFMIATAFLSMFISNTATAIMMLPIGIAVITAMETSTSKKMTKKFSVSLLLAIAYSASIGGIATIVGTPPNLAFHRIFEITFPNAPEISFSDWMVFGLPLSIILLTILWLLLTQVMYRSSKHLKIGKEVIKSEKDKLGKMRFEEKAVLIIFVITGILWIFRDSLNFGFIEIPGWASILDFGDYIDDGTVAIFMALFLFMIPSKEETDKTRLLTAGDFKKLPWEIVILFGGGFALAEGFHESGLSEIVGSYFGNFAGIPDIFIILLVCTFLTFLTELTSNTATTQTILPMLAGISISAGMNPLFLMIPATISASCAFMLPVATPPNAIVFGSSRLEIKEMVKMGIIMNLVGVIVISLFFYFVGSSMFGIESGEMPYWAE